MADKYLDNVLIQFPKDTDVNWAARDPVIPTGVAVYSSDKFWQYKIGDGNSKWSQLSYNKASTPYPFILQLNGSVAATHYGASSATVNITPTVIGAAAKSHTHTKSQITDMPTALKNPYGLTLQLNGANQTAYDGSAARTYNITPASIGAAPASGSTSISKLASTITLGDGNAATIYQKGGVYESKINIFNNVNANDAVFQFQQSTDSGKLFTTVFEIRNNSSVVATKFIGSLNGNSDTTNKFKISRKIGNAVFDGSADITLAQIGAAPVSHTHSYLPSGGGTLTGTLNINGPYSITHRLPSQPTGGHAIGTIYQNFGDSRFGGIGAYGSVGTYSAFYIGFGNDPWQKANSLYITNSEMTYKNSKVWHAGNDGAGSGLDADLLDGKQATAFALASHTHSYLPLSGGTLTGNATFTSHNSGVAWSRVSDGASILFNCETDATDNYLTFHVTDDENVNFKWTKNVAGTLTTLGTWKREGIRLGVGNFIGNLTGTAVNATNAVNASIPLGFSYRTITSSTWGNAIGQHITGWRTTSGGDIAFMNDNPVSGQVSMKLDGVIYQREGAYMCLDTGNYTTYAPPKSHASSATTYGIGNASNFGHVKLSDTYTSSVGAASTGIAPSQTALFNVYNTLNNKFSNYLSLTGGTVAGTVVLSKTTDLSGTANNGPALIVGGLATGQHLEFDSNEIHAKGSGTTVSTLYINNDGGLVVVGSGGFQSTGNIIASKDVIIGGCTLKYDTTNKCLNFNFA